MKLLTLNIQNYDGNWNKTKPNIIKFIKKEKPDFVFLQEVCDDPRYNKPGNNQALQLNSELKFKYNIYNIAERVKIHHNKPIKVPVFDGLCCLTNHKVISTKSIRLKKQSSDRHYRIIQKIEAGIQRDKIVFFHSHFSNRDDWAILHLKETLERAKKEKITPIIIGDLNMISSKDLIKTCKDKYRVSYEFKKYDSFPGKKETLDYVLIPKNTLKFVSLECNTKGLSDHKPLITIIEKR